MSRADLTGMSASEGRALAEMLVWDQSDRLRKSKGSLVIDHGGLL